MSMAHSLEIRMPFLDRSLVDFALRLPSHLKLHGGREKIILSRAARAYLPEEVAVRRKQGLMYPLNMWSDPACLRFARELLLDARDSPFDRQYLERKMPSLTAKRFHRIGRLVHLQAWWNEHFVHS
jgi:asparagine synthase (glutamine-hydrolysing)